MAKFSSNTGKVKFEDFLYLLRYIRNRKNLGLKYYANIEYETIYYVLRKITIKTEKKLMVFSVSI